MSDAVPSTPHVLGRGLKEMLVETSLDKVTVAALCRRCGLTRQTFYNHFGDIRELAVWVFTTEVANHILSHASLAEWEEGFERLLVYLADHREQTYAVTESLGLRDLERFFYYNLREMMRAIVAELSGDLTLRPADRSFIVDHFTLTVLGHLLHWLAGSMRTDPMRLAGDLEFILHGQVRQALERLAVRRD